MKIAVIGLWHLGSVTSACLANLGFKVIAFDDNENLIKNYLRDELPIYEPGLKDLVLKNKNAGNLIFTNDITQMLNADVLWVTYDTPVNDNDIAETLFVEERIVSLFPFIKEGAVLLVSSQMPVGSIARVKNIYEETFGANKIHFACTPENLRLGNAISVFTNPDRIVVGISSEETKQKLYPVLSRITENILWMSVASAEMTKHAINAFLATSVVFINELAVLCEFVGADASEVEQGLKSEHRIGPKSYLKPGNAFAGGTLARDLSYLVEKNSEFNIPALFFQSVIKSNSHHRDWAKNTIQRIYSELIDKNVCVLGLTYKPGTDTLRRSQSVELCKYLSTNHANVNVFDPVVNKLPSDLKDLLNLCSTYDEAMKNADLIIISTEWPQFLEINFESINFSRQVSVIDANGFLKKKFENIKQINYYRIGKADEIKK
jgi:UDPglucose 6-dehydrogenase